MPGRAKTSIPSRGPIVLGVDGKGDSADFGSDRSGPTVSTKSSNCHSEIDLSYSDLGSHEQSQ